MYRLFKVPGVRLHNVCTPYSPRTCSFCNFFHQPSTPRTFELDHLQIRHNSTTINNVMLSSVGKRKLRRKTKKYVELLEVTDSITSSRKAAVQNLNAAELSILVDQPDITLDKLHKIKGQQLKQNKTHKKSYTTSSESTTKNEAHKLLGAEYLDLANAYKTSKQSRDELIYQDELKDSIVEDLQSSGVVDKAILIKSSALAQSMTESGVEQNENSNTVTSEKSEEPEELKESLQDIIDKEQKAREEQICKDRINYFNKVLVGYMDVCVNSNSHTCAWLILDLYGRKKSNKPDLVYINDVSVYNVKIAKLAENGDLKNILEILHNTRKCNINLNAQTYVYILDCIACMKNDTSSKLELLKQVQQEMISDGVSLNDILTKTKFVSDQRTHVQDIIKLLDEDFEPNYEVPDVTYDCRLLQNLTLESATPCSTVEGVLGIEELEELSKEQVKVEIDGEVSVQNISRVNVSNRVIADYRAQLESLEKSWKNAAMKAFKRNIITLRSKENLNRGRKMMIYPFLSVLQPEDYVRILMREVRNLSMGSEMYSLPMNSLIRNVGAQVYKMYEIKKKQENGVNDKTLEVYLQYCDWFVKRDDKLNGRMKWTLLEHEADKEGVTLSAGVPSWSRNIHANIGRFLYNIILNDLKIDVSFSKKKKSHHIHGHYAPAFFKIFRHSGVQIKEEVKPHPLVSKLYRDSQPENLYFDTNLIPSLCPPRPWVSVNHGGYLITKSEIVRIANAGNLQWERLANSPPNKLYPALDSLNQLASIPWSINQPILDLAIKVFQDGGSVELNVPQPPSVLSPIASAPKDAPSEEKQKVGRERMELRRKKNEMYSLWCDALYRLSLANHFRNKIFWLPHNMDFRGRVYPIPPHLNHLGADLARSMLVFAKKKPLGPNGLDWLKLHCINLTGFKKREPVRERLRYANEILDKILDSAENPLTGEKWWAKSEEPWQTLSACMEIAAALKTPNPEEYLSGYPIHQDGSCNGLQHYAALGRDQIGAESVNLYPSDIPQDVYSSVATMVDERRCEDAANGNEIAQILEGYITRKVIKQTVMTTVYGVTWFGAKLQIARQLKDLDGFPQEHLWKASNYLVQKTFQTLRTMFKSAREIQDWFTECARLICISREENMEWVTPLGLPVVQPYSKIIQSNIKRITFFLSPDLYRKPNTMKQKNAFAPNFVHSLDSSHMMLTSIHCEHAGITFVSVHDCYWTHPCTVETMNKMCREQFVALHSEPILQDLSTFFIDKFGFTEVAVENKDPKKKNKFCLREKLNTTLAKVPKQGDFDLKGVLDSTYFFS